MKKGRKPNKQEKVYLCIDGTIVGIGTEANMINMAAMYDSDYALLDKEELTKEQLKQISAYRKEGFL